MNRSASISADGLYRYDLGRVWDQQNPRRLLWIMLNPSTADASIDDPTIRRCIGFSQRDGAGGMTVVNLFALRSTSPDALMESRSAACGPDNDTTLCACLHHGHFDRIVAAWGAWKGAILPARAADVIRTVTGVFGRDLHCLGTTRAGAPRHPLYVKGDQPFELFRPAFAVNPDRPIHEVTREASR